MEAVISAEAVRQKGNLNDFDDRDHCRRSLMDKDDFKSLNNLRNALAHGVRPFDQRLTKIISDPKALPKTLRDLFRKLGVSR